MACSGTKRVRERRSVWTDGTQSPLFLAALTVRVAEFVGVRESWDLEAQTGGLEARRAVRYSNDDGVSWTNPVEFGAIFSAATGQSWGAAFQPPDNAYQLAEFGVNVRNTSAGLRQMAQISFIFDIQEP